MARGITTQFTERLNESHSIFETSMDQLLKLHQARLGQARNIDLLNLEFNVLFIYVHNKNYSQINEGDK